MSRAGGDAGPARPGAARAGGRDAGAELARLTSELGAMRAKIGELVEDVVLSADERSALEHDFEALRGEWERARSKFSEAVRRHGDLCIRMLPRYADGAEGPNRPADAPGLASRD